METTKDRIINAAIELFSEKGYTETNMKSIAKMVNIKQSSIYNHFESKMEILEHILGLYTEHADKNTISLTEVDRLIKTEDAKSILRRMFYYFSPEDTDRYSKILKIILHEQFREPHAQEFVKTYWFKTVNTYFNAILEKLVAANKIKPINTGIYAKIFVSLTIASTTEAMFYTIPEYQSLPGRVRRADVLDFLFDQLLLPGDENHQSDRITAPHLPPASPPVESSHIH